MNIKNISIDGTRSESNRKMLDLIAAAIMVEVCEGRRSRTGEKVLLK